MILLKIHIININNNNKLIKNSIYLILFSIY